MHPGVRKDKGIMPCGKNMWQEYVALNASLAPSPYACMLVAICTEGCRIDQSVLLFTCYFKLEIKGCAPVGDISKMN